ncbi:alpha/beta hydrolase fold domain-containing protein [Actinosynnema sp. CS-041913]|uniref:alpha/beta hydrolase fold domain-containing protein n=1 Tax=Actinosynnema sp. CS-041913 TaxID=3239917 RepID=UPI003D8FDED7
MTDEASVSALPQAPDAIELRHLRGFVAVAQELNFGRAAARLYLSAPALSRQVRTLERLVGCDLLRRSTHRVELTTAGETFLDCARSLLRDLDRGLSVTRAAGGEFAARIARFWAVVGDTGPEAGLQDLRDTCEELHARFSPPPEVGVRPVNTGGVPSFLLSPRPDAPVRVLYLHGGAYVTGSAFGYRALAGAIAAAVDGRVVVPEFRLAPEHPFPAALEDAVRAYTWLLDTGADPRQVVVSGDSSGAGLALSLLLTLREHDLPQPGGAMLLCPSVDLTCRAFPEPVEGAPSSRLTRAEVRRFVDMYLAGHPIDDPVVSPLLADLSGLPPLLIQVGLGDPVRDEARNLAAHARAHGVDVRLEVYPTSTHVFQVFWSFLPEAADALAGLGRFTRDLAGRGIRRGLA